MTTALAGEGARVFDVQRFCIHDGPGIRSVVFFKGCPLRCRWCQNPESLRREPEILFYADRCRGCMTCASACPRGAIIAGAERVDRARCDGCGLCAEACPHEALRLAGREVTPQQLAEEVLADREYFAASGGGVTLSGGEPLLQAAAAAELLRRCRSAGIDTAVETSGVAPWPAFERVAPHVGRFLFDLKAGHPPLHRELTGVPLAAVVNSATRLVRSGAAITFRMPVVPGLNDGEASLRGVLDLLERLSQQEICLLRYHRGGEAKIARLGSDQPELGIASDTAETALERARAFFADAGVRVTLHESDGPARAATLSPRLRRLREAVQAAKPAVCAERGLLVTDYFKRRANRRKPMLIQKAEALAHVLRGRSAAIHDDELLVGSFSSKRVGGSLYPELHGIPVLLEDLWAFDRRQLNPLQIDPRDRRALALKVIPFWTPRFLGLRAFSLARAARFIVEQLGGREYLINESGGISHFVPDYGSLLREGSAGIAARARKAAAEAAGREQRDFYCAVGIVCDALADLATPYAAQARRRAQSASGARRAELERIAEVCERVPRHPARTLHEALQSLLFAQIALNLESLDNAVSPGRLDQLLLPYYEADLAAGRLDEAGARELIGCFSVKLSEIIPVFSRRITRFHGGLFSGQVVVVGGTDAAGRDATNPLTWLFFEAMDALRMRQPNYHARIHAGSPPRYVARVARMLRDGSAAPSLINDDVVVPMLVDRGTALADARDYSPVGCVEPVACGATFGSTDAALVNLALPLERALGLQRGRVRTSALTARSIDGVVRAFAAHLEELVRRLVADLQAIERANARLHPTPLTSALLRGCLESGRDSTVGGARYNGSGVQGVGVADVADSLAAIEEVVFRRAVCDLATLRGALAVDFAGHEALRAQLLRAPKYGNDDAAADRFARRVMRLFAEALDRHMNTRGGRYWAGFYSVTAHRAFGEVTGALPSGRRAGASLASGLSPVDGADRRGPTAALCSAASGEARSWARNGVNVNLKLDAAALAGEAGVGAVAGLIRGYFARGGMQFQVNAIDPAQLVEARDHPGRYPGLLVRVSGYSAYFDDLSPEMKDEIIARSVHRGGG